MSKLSITRFNEKGEVVSYSSFVIEDEVVYTNPIHGFSKDKVGEIDEDGNITIELKPI